MKEEKENEKEKEEEDEKFSRVKLSLSESRFSTVRLEDTTRSDAVGSGDGGSGASSRSLNNFERGPWVRRCSDIPDTLPGPSGVLFERFTYIVALVAEAAAPTASLPANIALS
uniref:Uncharacterized protein n=1 Tax=Vespula pensylvanica TaxID=30213 RepID=A0A834UCS7_VESPE|nr:hypothetical protein H0235_004704 [Vespula pensylvanica]